MKLHEDQIDAIIQGNPGVWLEGFAKIKTASGKLESPRLNILQRRILAVHMARRARNLPVRGIGLKPRKRGFSTMVSAIHYTELQKHSYEACIVGNKLETSDTVFRMMKVYHEQDEIAKEGKWGGAAKWNSERAVFEHGSLLAQSSAMNGESIRGQTPQLLHGTEVGHWQRDAEVLLALLNAVPDDPSTSVWLESTPNGDTNAFAVTWKGARWPTDDECPDGAAYWRYFESDCPDTPDCVGDHYAFIRVFAAWFEFEEVFTQRLTDDEKAQIQATLDDRSWYKGEHDLIKKYGNIRESNGVMRLGLEVETADVWEQLAWRRSMIRNKCKFNPKKFDQEYPSDPASCFLASGNPVFDSDAVADYKAASRNVSPDHGTIELNRDESRATWKPCGPDMSLFWRWETPKLGCSYLIVVDPAVGEDQTSGSDPDRHSVLVLRRGYRDNNGTLYKPRVVARIAPPCRVPLNTLVEWTYRLYLYYGRCVVLPEMNNSGLAFIIGAQAKNMSIWKRQEFDPSTGKKEAKLGWKTTDTADYGGVRTLIIDTLSGILRERELDCACPHIAHEMGVFVVEDGKSQAASGEHDDDILALAIGMYNIDQATMFAEPVVQRLLPRDLLEDDTGDNMLAMRS